MPGSPNSTPKADRPGLKIDVPGYGSLQLHWLVTDYTGTLSIAGRVGPEVKQRLQKLASYLEIHVLTSDTFGTVAAELANLPVQLHVLAGSHHDGQKREYVIKRCDPARVAALGNGNNDRLMLAAVKEAGGLAVAVDNGEGCSTAAIAAAHILVHGATAALDLLLEPRRLVATLRR